MQNFNFHTHTVRCLHAEDAPDEKYVQAHIEKGLKRMAFTDHCPLINPPFTSNPHCMSFDQKDEYLQSIRSLQKKYRDEITIYCGYELEYTPNRVNEVFDRRKESDILILGQHFVMGPDGKERHMHQPNMRDDVNNFNYYSDAVVSGLRTGCFDILAHPDLFGLFDIPFDSVQEKISDMILHEAEISNTPIEINLGNAYRNISEGNRVHYPVPEFWKMAKAYKVEVVYGIDAHCLEAINIFDRSVDLVNKMIGSETISQLHFIDEIKFEKDFKYE